MEESRTVAMEPAETRGDLLCVWSSHYEAGVTFVMSLHGEHKDPGTSGSKDACLQVCRVRGDVVPRVSVLPRRNRPFSMEGTEY